MTELKERTGPVLHPYQRRAVAAVLDAWQNHQSALMVMATGLGKTICMASLIAQRRDTGRAMLLAHREELVHQAAEKIHWVSGIHADIEMADFRADQAWSFWKSPVVVSTVQTQNSGMNGDGRMARFDPREFSTVFCDEAHHFTAGSFRNVLDHYRKNEHVKILGVTATPNRHDEEALGQVFDAVAYQYGLLDAINDGWLTPIRAFTMHIESLDISRVHITAGDLNGAELAREMQQQKPLLAMADCIWREARGRKTLVFAASVEHARLLTGIFNTDYQSGCARFISGRTPKDERRDILQAYRRREFSILCNCAVFGEGFDDAGIEVVVPRPTKSTPAYLQMIGRATRTLPGIIDGRVWDDDQRELGIEGEQDCAALRRKLISESAKPYCEVFDLFCQAGRHRLVTADDALGGNYTSDVVERARAAARSATCAEDPRERLQRAEKQVRMEAEVRLKRQRIDACAKYTKTEVNPFAYLGIPYTREMGWNKHRRPTGPMIAVLERNGIDAANMSFAEAGRLIAELRRRRENGLATAKQARLLVKFGFRGDVTFAEAGKIIDTLAQNGWRWPDGVPRPRHHEQQQNP